MDESDKPGSAGYLWSLDPDNCPCGCGKSVRRLTDLRELYVAVLLARRNKEENNHLYRQTTKSLDEKYTMLTWIEEENLHKVRRAQPEPPGPKGDRDHDNCPCGYKRKRAGDPPNNNDDGWERMKTNERAREVDREERAFLDHQ